MSGKITGGKVVLHLQNAVRNTIIRDSKTSKCRSTKYLLCSYRIDVQNVGKMLSRKTVLKYYDYLLWTHWLESQIGTFKCIIWTYHRQNIITTQMWMSDIKIRKLTLFCTRFQTWPTANWHRKPSFLDWMHALNLKLPML